MAPPPKPRSGRTPATLVRAGAYQRRLTCVQGRARARLTVEPACSRRSSPRRLSKPPHGPRADVTAPRPRLESFGFGVRQRSGVGRITVRHPLPAIMNFWTLTTHQTPPVGFLYTSELAADLAGHQGVPALFQPVADSGSAAAIAGLRSGPEPDPLLAPVLLDNRSERHSGVMSQP
jgi:hypothetical protein